MTVSAPIQPRSARSRREGVRVTTPAPRDVWETILAADPHALVTYTPAWTDFVCGAGGFDDASRLYELPNGRRLVLPALRRRALHRRLAVEASFPPSWGMGGIVAPGGLRPEDAAAVFADLAGRDVLRMSLRPNPLDGETLRAARPPGAVTKPLLAHVLDLEGGFGEVWRHRFSGTARTAVRKAERSDITVERDTSGKLVPVLYKLYDLSIDRWARQQHEPLALARWRGHRNDPRQKFEAMARALGDTCRIWVAWCGNQPAAAMLVLQGKNATYSRGMMDKQLAGPTRANYLLHRLAIEEACEAGCRHYHMGESGRSASLAQFKTRFGARPHAHAEFHFERMPLTALDSRARGIVRRIVGFRDS